MCCECCHAGEADLSMMWKAAWMVSYLRTGLCVWTFAAHLMELEELVGDHSAVVGPGVVLSK
jgi:hypothetical protein